jgi:hypothetical protein
MNKILLVSFLLSLSGCVAAPLVLTGVGAASVATNETTGKSITDHAVSTVRDKDCKVSRMFSNQSVCQDNIPEFKLRVTTTTVTPSSIEEIESKYR